MQPVRRRAAAGAIVDRVPERRPRLRGVPPRCLSSPVARTVPGTPARDLAPGVRARLPRGPLPSRPGRRRCGRGSTPQRRASSPWCGRGLGTLARSDALPPGRTAVPLGCAGRAWGRETRPGAGPPGSRTPCFRAGQGSATPPGAAPPCRRGGVAGTCRVCGARRHPGRARWRGSIPGLHLPLSPLLRTP